MASVITIQGAEDEPKGEACRTRAGKVYKLGECKTVKNRRTNCEYQICCVGKKKSKLTGWAFKAKSHVCKQKNK